MYEHRKGRDEQHRQQQQELVTTGGMAFERNKLD
jgi:hypothetical protein